MSILAVDSIRGMSTESDVTIGSTVDSEFINLGPGVSIDGEMFGSNKRHISLSMSTENVSFDSDSEHGRVSLHMPYAFNLTKIKLGLSVANGNGNMDVDFSSNIGLVDNKITIMRNATITSSPDLDLDLDRGALVTARLDLNAVDINGMGLKLYLIGKVT